MTPLCRQLPKKLSAGRFHTEYDNERSYSKEELAQIFASAEWQADTMGAALLMPKHIIENALVKYNRSQKIKIYGDNTITQRDKGVIRKMAKYIGVSYTAFYVYLNCMQGKMSFHEYAERNVVKYGSVSAMVECIRKKYKKYFG